MPLTLALHKARREHPERLAWIGPHFVDIPPGTFDERRKSAHVVLARGLRVNGLAGFEIEHLAFDRDALRFLTDQVHFNR